MPLSKKNKQAIAERLRQGFWLPEDRDKIIEWILELEAVGEGMYLEKDGRGGGRVIDMTELIRLTRADMKGPPDAA